MREYDEVPRPTIEDHYHIRELIEGQEKRTRDRIQSQNTEKNRDLIVKDIAGFRDVELLDFWCERCRIDFIAKAPKMIDSWSNEVAYYKTKHRCGEWALRRITDRLFDSYFFRSRKVAIDRGQSELDMLQPYQTGFNLLYGKQ